MYSHTLNIKNDEALYTSKYRRTKMEKFWSYNTPILIRISFAYRDWIPWPGMAASWLELHQCWFKTCTASMLVRLSSPGTPQSCRFKTSPLQLPPTWDGRWWVERFGPGNPPSPAAVTVRTSCICSFVCLVIFGKARYSWRLYSNTSVPSQYPYFTE